MKPFDNGWMHVLGVLSVLYILFGSNKHVKITAFVMILFVAIAELTTWIVMNK